MKYLFSIKITNIEQTDKHRAPLNNSHPNPVISRLLVQTNISLAVVFICESAGGLSSDPLVFSGLAICLL